MLVDSARIIYILENDFAVVHLWLAKSALQQFQVPPLFVQIERRSRQNSISQKSPESESDSSNETLLYFSRQLGD